jgi:hypothetical protein
MVDHSQTLKWRVVDSAAAHTLTTVTNSPGVVYPLAVDDLPKALQRIPGVGSYYVSGTRPARNYQRDSPRVARWW